MEYLNKKESNILKVYDFCKSVKETIKNNIKLDLAKDLDQLQNFEINFIEKDVDINLDKKTKIPMLVINISMATAEII
jgi:hypothetical protein